MEKVYVLNVDDVNDYITENNPNCEEIVGELESFDEETCKKIVENSMDYNSEVLTLEEFVAAFNYDVNAVYNSDKYFIRIFDNGDKHFIKIF